MQLKVLSAIFVILSKKFPINAQIAKFNSLIIFAKNVSFILMTNLRPFIIAMNAEFAEWAKKAIHSIVKIVVSVIV